MRFPIIFSTCLLLGFFGCGRATQPVSTGGLPPGYSVFVVHNTNMAGQTHPNDYNLYTARIEQYLSAGGNPVVGRDPIDRRSRVATTQYREDAADGLQIETRAGVRTAQPAGDYDYVLEYGFRPGPTVGRVQDIQARLVDARNGRVVASFLHPRSRGVRGQTERLLLQTVRRWQAVGRGRR